MRSRTIILCSALAITAACSPAPVEEPTAAPSTAVLYQHARVIPGDGAAPLDDASFLVDGGIITEIRSGALAAPAGATTVDLTGKTVMPALIGAHGHVGYQKGLTFARENYTRENILADLRLAAYFGLGTAMTMGIDTTDLVYKIREETAAGTLGVARLRTAGQGIGGPGAGPGNAAYAEGVAYAITTEEQGRAAVTELAPHAPDMVKIWLDERGGRGQKLRPEVVRAIVDEARKHGLPVTAHVRGHADAETAVSAGAYGLAHLARDREMDDALVAAIVSKGVYVTPTLSMAERNNYSGAVPAWLEEPYLAGLLADSLPPEVLSRLRDSFVQREPEAAANARKAYDVLHRTVAKLNKAGARIVLGADTGLPDHVWGLAEQRELELLVAAGLTPMQAVVAGTSRAAEFLKMPKVGTLAAGNIADFLVLDANPLDDIRNTRRIADLYIQGHRVDRAAMRTEWAAARGK